MLRPGQTVFLCALALLAIGVIMVNSASMSVGAVNLAPAVDQAAAPPQDPLPQGLSGVLLGRSAAYMLMAVVAMSAASVLPVWRLGGIGGAGDPGRRSSRGIVVLGLGCVLLLAALSLVYVPGLSSPKNGAYRWINVPLPGLGATSIQPSEIAKWGAVILLAIYGASRAEQMRSFFRGLAPGLVAIGMVAAVVAHEDLGTGVLIMLTACVVLLAAGARLWQFLIFIPPATAAFLALVLSNDYRLTRIETFINPYMDPQGKGFHMIQSMLAVAGGEGFGRGLGYGLQKFGYLLEDHTDFIFGVLCEELGIAGAAVVIFLYGVLLWSALSIVRQQQSMTLKLIGLGIFTTIGLQALINLAVVTGLAPTKGIALPLISSGGTGWILTAASLGLLIAMDGIEQDEQASAGRASGMIEGRPAQPSLATT